ncbi:dermatopontin-like [Mya arenaria]|uniref:dermatopontin-like n=1 Tax=Mya arenaria TaxID=6604 RepID=UPI0022E28D05|nr:dermatopontin-like [Mya arenaria]
MHSYACLIVAILLTSQSEAVNYVNNFDEQFFFACPNPDEFVNHVESIHSNGAEDRRFAFSCSKVPSSGQEEQGNIHCLPITGYVNDFDGPLAFQCNDNYYINGMGSRHDNHPEDRIWQFKCCGILGMHMDDCKYTGWTNTYDQPQMFNAENGYITRGVVSVHNNGPEDRLYEYEICQPLMGETSPIVG